MANANRPAGLVPVEYLNGAPWTGGGRVYCILQANANAFAIGDPVVSAGTSDSAGVPAITLATAGATNPVLGAMVSGAGSPAYAGSFGVPAESPIVIPATKTRNYYVLVCDDPNVIYEVQEDAIGGAMAAADVGLNVDLIAGTNNGFISQWLLDSSSKGAGATLQMKILALAQKSEENTFGTSAKFWCLINVHQFKAGVAGL